SLRLPVLAVAVLTAAVQACSKAPPPPPPQPAAPPPEQQRSDSIARAQAAAQDAARRLADQRRQDSLQQAQRVADARRDSLARAESARRAAEAEQNMLRGEMTTVIHFDFDKSDLRDEDRAALDRKIPILQANSTITIKITGNADERGSDEY